MKIIILKHPKDLPYHNTLNKMAKMSKCRTRVSAILIKGGKIISHGINSEKTSPIINKYKSLRLDRNGFQLPSVGTHAEFDCVNGISKSELSKSTIIVYRIKRDGKAASSLPCKMCIEYLNEIGVKKIKCLS